MESAEFPTIQRHPTVVSCELTYICLDRSSREPSPHNFAILHRFLRSRLVPAIAPSPAAAAVAVFLAHIYKLRTRWLLQHKTVRRHGFADHQLRDPNFQLIVALPPV